MIYTDIYETLKCNLDNKCRKRRNRAKNAGREREAAQNPQQVVADLAPEEMRFMDYMENEASSTSSAVSMVPPAQAEKETYDDEGVIAIYEAYDEYFNDFRL